jgi:Mn-containing catalase
MGNSWNNDFITTTGNVVFDLLHNFHLECGARLHKLRVYGSLTDPTGLEVCGYLLVRGSVHAHAYALALKNITGVDIEKMLPTPNINLDKIPESQKYLEEGSHSRLYTFSPKDYKETSAIWGNGEQALPVIWSSSMVCPMAARSISSPVFPPPSRRTTLRKR